MFCCGKSVKRVVAYMLIERSLVMKVKEQVDVSVLVGIEERKRVVWRFRGVLLVA